MFKYWYIVEKHLYYIPGFFWRYNGNDELLSEYLNIKIEDNKLVNLKEKQYTILDKSYEHVVGGMKITFFFILKLFLIN